MKKERTVFLSKDLAALREMGSPDVIAKAKPPDEKMVNLFFSTFKESIGYEIPTPLRARFF